MPRPKEPTRETYISVIADDERGELQVGSALVVKAAGLKPGTVYEVALDDDKGEILRQSVMADAQGTIRPTAVWAQVGLDDPRDRESIPVAKLRKAWLGRNVSVTVFDDKSRVVQTAVKLSERPGPLAVASDSEGRLLNGFEIGKHDVTLTLLDFKKGTNLRVWMVARQHQWLAGDHIRPITLTTGKAAFADVTVKGAGQVAPIFDRKHLVAGAFDFVVRSIRYGYEDDDDLVLRPTDLVTGNWATGLVIREEFMASKVIGGGCANLQQIAARRTLGGNWPYVQFTDTFQVGEDVWGTIDPNALDPAHAAKAAAIYVVPHKTAAEWTADNSLNHLAVLGGNANVQKWVTQTWCANANLRLLWPAASEVGDYDIVVDFGNNSPDLAGFIPDDHYDMPLDMIDGYILPGFRVAADPAIDTSFAFAGSFSYDQTTQGSVTVSGDGNTTTVPVKANVRFPADVAGQTSPSQISAAQASYPVVVVVHGNSGHINSFEGYDYLLDHLARNGFIAASIHLQPGQNGTDRARVLQAHLPIIASMFGAKAANNIGLMGHSRGGEAVVIAARLNNQEAWGWNINAVIPLAPTNQYTFENYALPWAKPLLVIYGSSDGDLGGIGDTGFEIYDHASGANKSMAFVYRACHDRFNTVWGSDDFGFGQLTTTDQAEVISENSHQLIAKGYMAGFFRQHLKNETQFEGIFRGEWIPASVQASNPTLKIFNQYEDTNVRTVDNFEGAHSATSWQTSTISAAPGAVSQVGLPVTPVEAELRSVDAHSPHLTGGLVVQWDNTTDSIEFQIPAGQRNVSGFTAVSFRVTQRVDSASNPVGLAQDLRLALLDGGGHSREIRVSKLTEIPAPHVRGVGFLTKSAMCTVRIPLSAYHIHCFNVDQVDLTDVTTLSFRFSEKLTGEIEIDTIQFTN